MITIDTTNNTKKKRSKIARVSPKFDSLMNNWILDGEFKDRTEITEALYDYHKNSKWKKRTIIPFKITSKPKPIRWIKKDKSKRRKIELEFG